MKKANTLILYYKSLLNRKERKLLSRINTLDHENKPYQIRNYYDCQIFIKVAYKLEWKTDYLLIMGKENSDAFKAIKAQIQTLNKMIKDYSKTL